MNQRILILLFLLNVYFAYSIDLCQPGVYISVNDIDTTFNDLKYIIQIPNKVVEIDLTIVGPIAYDDKIIDSLKYLPNLSEIVLWGSKSKLKPGNFGRFINLRRLDVSGYSNFDSKIFFSDLKNCKYLKKLDLQNNKIKILTDEFSNLSAIERIDFRGNEIKSFPATVNKMKTLISLNLSYNDLTELPLNIECFDSLKGLSLSFNPKLNAAKAFTRLSKLKKFEILDMNRDSLDKLPENISLLKELSVLDVNENDLETLPESIIELKKLKFIWARMNRISKLPDCYKQIPKGLTIILTGNKLTEEQKQKFINDFPNIKFAFDW